jgi:hypothetical protein
LADFDGSDPVLCWHGATIREGRRFPLIHSIIVTAAQHPCIKGVQAPDDLIPRAFHADSAPLAFDLELHLVELIPGALIIDVYI